MDNIFLTLTHYSIDNIIYDFYIQNKHTGIGNMLFQISSCLAYSIKYNKNLCVPALDVYLKKENLQKQDSIFRNICSDCPAEYFEIKNDHVKYSQDCGNENREFILNILPYKNMNFFGYIENWKNFIDYREQILNCFRPIQTDVDYIYNKYPILNKNITNIDNICSIHVRLGSDYLKIPSLKAQIMNYQKGYHDCLDHMIQQKKIATVFVFTDNKDYCRKIFDTNPKYSDIKFIYSYERDYIDVWTISLIKNNIVSMSTMAWWGSFLNEYEDKYIVCYKTNRPDLHYPGWIVI